MEWKLKKRENGEIREYGMALIMLFSFFLGTSFFLFSFLLVRVLMFRSDE